MTASARRTCAYRFRIPLIVIEGKWMQVWVDADACPVAIKELLFRAAKRTKTRVTLVANQPISMPRSEFIDSLLVGADMNAADRRILELVEPGDLVITADIPLAAEVVANGAEALDPRGELYTDSNVGERIAVRNLLDELRGGGLVTGGPANFNAKKGKTQTWRTKVGKSGRTLRYRQRLPCFTRLASQPISRLRSLCLRSLFVSSIAFL